jgi:hypothetical protein
MALDAPRSSHTRTLHGFFVPKTACKVRVAGILSPAPLYK